MSFAPFAIDCVTCGSRLRVRDEAQVGTIANCPACGSLVRVEFPVDDATEPSDVSPPKLGSGPVDSDAVTADAVEADQQGFLATRRDGQPPFAASESLSPAEVATADPDAFQSDQTRRRRQIAAVLVTGAAATILAVVLFFVFVGSLKPELADGSAGGSNVTPAAQAATDPVAANPIPAREVGAAEVATKPAEVATKPADAAVISNRDRVADEVAQPISPDEDAVVEIDPSAAGPSESADLLGSVTDSVFVPSATVTDDDAETAAIEELRDLPPGLSDFLPSLLLDAPEAATNLDAPPSLDDFVLDDASEEDDLDPYGRRPERTIEPDVDLAIKLAVDARSARGVDLLLLLTEISGVPIELDHASLDLADAPIDRVVEVPREWMPAEELLERVTTATETIVRFEPTLAVVTVDDDSFAAASADVVQTTDFPDPAAAKALIESFVNVAQPPPASDDDPIPGDVVSQRGFDQLRMLATDALRRMRDVPAKIDDTKMARWSHRLSVVTGWSPLAGGTTVPAVDTPESIATVLRRLGRVNEVVIWFGWRDALDRNLFPDDRAMIRYGGSAADAMRWALEPAGLQTRQISPTQWWVGTESTYDRLPVVVWSDRLGEKRLPLENRLLRTLGEPGPANYHYIYDEVSDRALMLLPRFVARQLNEQLP